MHRSFVASLLLLAAAGAAEPVRERLLMDPGWRFSVGAPDLGDGVVVQAGLSVATNQNFGAFAKAGSVGGPAARDFNDLGWRRVDLPHDWAVELPFSPKGDCAQGSKAIGPKFPSSSVAWYRRTFTVPAADEARHIAVEFDGVFRDAQFFCNGHYLGRNFSGYAPVTYDLTPYLQFGRENVLSVQVDASSYEGWFYEGAGIYRHVWLVKTAPVRVPMHGTWVTATVSGDPAAPEGATVVARTTIRNDGDAVATVTVPVRLLAADGAEVATGTAPAVTVAPGKEVEVPVTLTVARPHLWSTTDPYRYRVEHRVLVGDALVDQVETPIGIRTTRWDPDHGFFLNGVHTFLKGTCNHQDHAGIGTALPDRVNVWRIERLVAMGCNAYRTSHHPPTPEVLEACDRLGVLVMDEARMVGASEEALSQLDRLIRRDRNHPSVVIWSLGNEEMGIQGTSVGARVLAPMQRLAKELDPTRPTTIAMNGSWGQGFSPVVDVQGCNYHQLSGGYDAFHRAFPRQPIVGSEDTSHTTTRGVYREEPGRFTCQADEQVAKFPGWANRAEDTLRHHAERPYVAGFFAWTGFDYRGEPTPFHHWPSISSHFGILDTCGFAKDLFFYYQAQWTSAPMLHLLPHWNWPAEQIGKPVNVRCDSNAEEVELVLNGVSQGRKPMPALGHVNWSVDYQPGTMTATGYRDGRVVATQRIETSGPAATVRLVADRPVLAADGEDVAMITVSVADAQGRPVPTAGQRIAFELQGPGRILGVGNGDSLCHEPDQYGTAAPVVVPGNWTSALVTDPAAAIDPAFDDRSWKPASCDGRMVGQGQTGVWRGTFTLTPETVATQDLTVVTARLQGAQTLYWDGVPLTPASSAKELALPIPLTPGRHVLAVVVTPTGKSGGLQATPFLRQTVRTPEVWSRSLYNGLAQIIVQTRRSAGPITLTAQAEGLTPASLVLTATPAPGRPVAP